MMHLQKSSADGYKLQHLDAIRPLLTSWYTAHLNCRKIDVAQMHGRCTSALCRIKAHRLCSCKVPWPVQLQPYAERAISKGSRLCLSAGKCHHSELHSGDCLAISNHAKTDCASPHMPK